MVWRVHFKKWNQLQLKCLPNVTIEKEAAAAQTKKKNIETKHSIKSRKFTCLLCVYFCCCWSTFPSKEWQMTIIALYRWSFVCLSNDNILIPSFIWSIFIRLNKTFSSSADMKCLFLFFSVCEFSTWEFDVRGVSWCACIFGYLQSFMSELFACLLGSVGMCMSVCNPIFIVCATFNSVCDRKNSATTKEFRTDR